MANIYSALAPNSRQVRVVTLQPGGWSDHIDCQLEVADLELNPAYEALSYVWGPSTENHSIRLNGHKVAITDNLYYALRRLRWPQGCRTLWIDRLVINQDDLDERNHQVTLMGGVYGQAAHVILWLGEEPDRLTSCFPPAPFPVPRTRPGSWNLGPFEKNEEGDYCRFKAVQSENYAADEDDYIHHAFRLIASLAKQRVHLSDQPYFGHNTVDAEEDKLNNHVFRALDFLMRRPWWTRMWTLQECVLPSNANRTTITYGPVGFPLVVVIWASRFYSLHSGTCCAAFHRRLPKVQSDILDHFYRTMADLYWPWDFRRRWWKIGLESTLRLSRRRQATDDRDKVYGLLGLLLDWGNEEPIVPDYRLAATQIYQTMTLKLIRLKQSLSVLGDCIHNGGINPAIPSWVVDWSVPETFRYVTPIYKASADTKATFAEIGNSVLCLTGFKVDTIQRLGPPMDFTKSKKETSDTFKCWQNLAAESTAYNGSPDQVAVDGDESNGAPPNERSYTNKSSCQAWRDAFWRTLCGDGTFKPGPKSDSGLSVGRAEPRDYTTFLMWCKDREPVLLDNAVSDDPQLDLGLLVVDEDRSATMDMSIRGGSARRQMFLTLKGYIGLAPPKTQCGDEVFILNGGAMPFLLRDAGDRVLEGLGSHRCYTLVGQCYLHGIMDAEAMSWGLKDENVYLV